MMNFLQKCGFCLQLDHAWARAIPTLQHSYPVGRLAFDQDVQQPKRVNFNTTCEVDHVAEEIGEQ
jgi:hypothetical protein